MLGVAFLAAAVMQDVPGLANLVLPTAASHCAEGCLDDA